MGSSLCAYAVSRIVHMNFQMFIPRGGHHQGGTRTAIRTIRLQDSIAKAAGSPGSCIEGHMLRNNRHSIRHPQRYQARLSGSHCYPSFDASVAIRGTWG